MFGPTGKTQIIDLNANNASIFTPAYAIYEGGSVARVALFNYMTDPTGANTYTATIAVGGGQTGTPNATPAQVQVKYVYLLRSCVSGNLTFGEPDTLQHRVFRIKIVI